MSVEVGEHIFRQYDVRGIVGDDADLNEGVAELLGRGYGVLARRKLGKSPEEKLKISIGRDVRLSSSSLRDGFMRGLRASGIDCVDIGECPTPLQYFSIHHLDLDGGVMITGSHNPPEYNGFKISIGKETIHGEEIQALKDIIKGGDIPGAVSLGAAPGTPEDTSEGTVEEYPIVEPYIEYLAEKFGGVTEGGPIKIAIDSGNGTGGLAGPELLRRIGCEVVELFSEPDGSFPNHHPDPTVEENLEDLKGAVRENGCDFGVAYDGDGDRIGAVDETGEVIWGDELMIIYGREILNSSPGATIVGEVKCSQVMYDEIEKAGGNGVMWKTGHSLIKSKMKELKAAMAGEMSGHIFFADRYFGFDDALYATCRLVEILAGIRRENGSARFSSLLGGLPQTVVTPEIRVDCPDSEKFDVVDRLKGEISAGPGGGVNVKDIVTIDGLRVIFDSGWALVRASNTQPVLVLRFEASTSGEVEALKGYMKEKIGRVYPDFGGF